MQLMWQGRIVGMNNVTKNYDSEQDAMNNGLYEHGIEELFYK